MKLTTILNCFSSLHLFIVLRNQHRARRPGLRLGLRAWVDGPTRSPGPAAEVAAGPRHPRPRLSQAGPDGEGGRRAGRGRRRRGALRGGTRRRMRRWTRLRGPRRPGGRSRSEAAGKPRSSCRSSRSRAGPGSPAPRRPSACAACGSVAPVCMCVRARVCE